MSLPLELKEFYLRDFEALVNEVKAYPDTRTIWKVMPGTTNSGGTLILHLIGNLQHFIIKGIEGNDFIRDRDGEFSQRDVSKEELLTALSSLKTELEDTLEKVDQTILNGPYPIEWKGGHPSGSYMLTQMLAHLNYHLGQINYHRRFFSIS